VIGEQQERSMFGSTKDYVRDALITTALFGTMSFACAQAPASTTDKDQAGQPSSNQTAQPTAVPGHAGVEEPGAKNGQPAAETGVFVNGTLTVPGASADTATAPAKFSQANNARDQIPIMARGPALSDAQRKLIVDHVLADSGATARATTGPAMELPPAIAMQAWPSDIADQVPSLSGTKYVKLADKILVVQPDNRIVVGEIVR
jgi:hypothetical protein